jgi:4-amino-4-deoxy-L-arabinose transferase-like glycosyltransferase
MFQTRIFLQDRQNILLLVLIIIVLLSGWGIPLMEVDAVQYANISREMMHSGNYLQVYDSGADYLDKPPMLFWLSALSMRLFGVSAMAYRFPSFCFTLITLYSCFRLCRIWYNRDIAWISVFVLASCQAMFLISHDVRTDTMLMGWVTLSLWQLAAWYQAGKWKHFLLATVAIAGGIMTKGPVALMIPAFAFLPHFILRREWRNIFRWEYLLMAVLIVLLLSPVLAGLYLQFDQHPEKIMYGQQGISGVRFFLWTQSFGRITGESTWHEYSSFTFLFENMLWSFLPWILFFIPALCLALVDLFRKKFRLSGLEEAITTGGFLISYCALASSQAQLPHYIFVAFPFAAIITGKFLYNITAEKLYPVLKKVLWISHIVIFVLLWIALIALLYFAFPVWNKLSISLVLAAVLVLCAILYRRINSLPPLIKLCIIPFTGINLLVSVFLYPALLQYQPSVPVTAWIKAQHVGKARFYTCNFDENRSISFYNDYTVKTVATPEALQQNDYCLLKGQVWDTMQQQHFEVLYKGESMHITMLTFPFLNPATRSRETELYYIIRKR